MIRTFLQNRPRDLLARLAGAQPAVLAKTPVDRTRFTAMGGVLISTAAVATVSAVYALSAAVGLPVWAAVVAGLLWGVIILNLDRMLVVSMTKGAGWWPTMVSVASRLMLAFVIGTVVSTPLVLRIFEPEINAELQVMHTQNLTEAQKDLDARFADIEEKQRKADELRDIVAGRIDAGAAADPDVVAAKARVDEAQNAYDTAAAKAQCELDGTCGTGDRGIGTAYNEAKAREDEANAALGQAKADLAAVETAARDRISTGAAEKRDAARRELDQLTPQLEQRKADRVAAQERLDRGEQESEGLLSRLEALERVSADSRMMGLAHLAVFLLFLLVEVLPVLVKVLMLFGRPTTYDAELAKFEARTAELANLTEDADQAIATDRVRQQVDGAKAANALLATKQRELAETAVDYWAKVAEMRNESQLAAWYRQHTGLSISTADRPAPEPPAVRVSTPPPTSYAAFRAERAPAVAPQQHAPDDTIPLRLNGTPTLTR